MQLLGQTTTRRKAAKPLMLFLASSGIAAAGVAQSTSGSGDLNSEVVIGLIGIIGALIAMLKTVVGARESYARHDTTEAIQKLQKDVALLKQKLGIPEEE